MTKSTFAWIGLGLSLLLLIGFHLAARPTPPHALRQSEVLALVAGQSLPESIVLQIKTREIDFRPDGAYRALLTAAGADPSVLQALDAAGDSFQNYAASDQLKGRGPDCRIPCPILVCVCVSDGAS
jgi:hypothetical protein